MKQGAYQLRLTGNIILFWIATSNLTQAQIVPDATLPVNSTVNSVGQINIIGGGTQAGNNLFHSFQQFSVPTNSTAIFGNTFNIQNIITRVTGGSVSNIDGLIQTQGSANLFFLNPNGIIFGPNASLKIGGSFLASTAQSLIFKDGSQFSATASQTTPLLTVSVPIGLQYGGTAGEIRVQQSRLEMPTGKTLALVGGDVRLDGGSLEILGGRVELGGVTGTGTVGLSVNDNNLHLSFPDGLARSDVFLTNGTSIDVRTGFSIISEPIEITTIEVGSEGSIAINARNLYVLGESQLKAGVREPDAEVLKFVAERRGLDLLLDIPRIRGTDFRELFTGIGGLGSDGFRAGDIRLNTTGAIAIDQSNITNTVDVYSPGHGGDINVQSGTLTLKGAQLLVSTEGAGNAGSISLQASESISFANSSISSAIAQGGVGDSGNLTIKTGSLSAMDGTKLEIINDRGLGSIKNVSIQSRDTVNFSDSGILIDSHSFGGNDNGSINIETTSLSLTDGAYLRTFIQEPQRISSPGSITINARERVSLSNSSISTEIFGGSIVVGKITINTRFLSLNEARLQTSLVGGLISSSGDIQIDATDSVSISGSGGLLASSGSISGRAGNIMVDTRAFHLSDGAVLDARATDRGRGGDVTVNANTFELMNGGQVRTTALSSGDAGDIILNISDRVTLEGSASGILANTAQNSTGAGGSLAVQTEQLIVRDGAQVTVSSDGSGGAGNLKLAADSIHLNSGAITATTKTGNFGNITLQTQDLQLRRNSQINTSATGLGGNITINTQTLAALENSDITANSVDSRGGRVIINARGIFGTEFREAGGTPATSDITATSELGREFSGTVEINTPDVNPTSSLLNLPENFVDVAGLIDRRCSIANPQRSTLINTGRGGKPPSPIEPLSTHSGWLDSRSSTVSSAMTEPSIAPKSDRIIEAQGWIINAKGQVELVAEAPTVTPYSSLSTPAACNGDSNAVEK